MRMLDGVRVVEATQIIAGPLAGSQLGDLGAEVIKVEPPGGEPARGFEPSMGGLSSYFAGVNRNKRYVTIDLKAEEGKAVFEEVIASADVLVENFRPDTMDRLDLGYERLREVNEGLIYCTINGYKRGSAYEDLPAFDGVVQALGGTMSITGEAGGPPVRAGVPVADIAAAMYAVQSVVAALYARREDGRGRRIEVPLLDAAISLLTVRAGYSFATGRPYPRSNTHSSIAPWTVFETSDGHLSVSASSEPLWERFCRAIDRSDLVDDERFATNADRVEHADLLYGILRPILRERTSAEWFERMKSHGAPAAPVYDTVELWEDPYVAAQGLSSPVADGEARVLEPPVHVDDERMGLRREPGEAGADTGDVLHELGFDEDDVDRLRRDGVVE